VINDISNKRARISESQRYKADMISFTRRSLMCCAVVGGLLASCGCAPAAIAQQKGAAQSGGTTAVEVISAGKATRKDLTFTTTQPAQIMAIEQAPIHSKLAAYVGEVLVDFGDKVKKGQPMLKLSAPELDAEFAQKQALLAQAQAELVQAEASARAAEAVVTTAQSRVVQAQAGTARADADLVRWKSEYERIGQLATSGSINRQIADETQQKLAAADASKKEAFAAIEAAKALVLESEAGLAKAVADIDAAKSRVDVAKANVKYVESMRSYLSIQAPFDGVATQRRVDPGHFVQPGGSNNLPLLVVARVDKIRIFIAVPEHEAVYVDLSDAVTLEVQSLRGAEFKGGVTRTGFALDPTNRSLEAICDIDNADGRLRPGMFGSATLILHEAKNALTLPSAAVVRQGKEAFCFRLVDRKATKTPIQVGIKVGDDFEVVSGLSDDQTVILNKASSLKDGQLVEVAKPPAK
jgi:HlyD family secretion protein